MREAIALMLAAAMPPIADRKARLRHGRSHLITHANERESR